MAEAYIQQNNPNFISNNIYKNKCVMGLRLFFLFPVALFPEQQVSSEQIEGDSECFSVFPLTDSSPESD